MTDIIRIGCTTCTIPQKSFTVHYTVILTNGTMDDKLGSHFNLKNYVQYSRSCNFNSEAKKTLSQVYKSLDWILMHPNSVPS